MSDDEETGDRQSPLFADGGIRVSGPAGIEAAAPAAYDGGLKVEQPPAPPAGYDPGAGFHGTESARSWDAYRAHPPLMCPDPRYSATMRGYYRCPGCGAKIRLAGDRTLREFGYDAADATGHAIVEALHQIRDIFRRQPVSIQTTNARAAAAAIEEKLKDHKLHCSQCSVAAGRRQWGAACGVGADLRYRLSEARAAAQWNAALDKEPLQGQERMF